MLIRVVCLISFVSPNAFFFFCFELSCFFLILPYCFLDPSPGIKRRFFLVVWNIHLFLGPSSPCIWMHILFLIHLSSENGVSPRRDRFLVISNPELFNLDGRPILGKLHPLLLRYFFAWDFILAAHKAGLMSN